MTISNQQRLYGQLIVDFANAVSTDEAGLGYFENIQKVFGFPPQFIDKAKTNFPTLYGFNSSLTDPEMQCFNLILEKMDIEREILSAINGEFLEYNIYSKSFHIRESSVDQSEDGMWEDHGNAESKCREFSVADIKEMVRMDHADPGYKSRQKNVSKILPELIKLGKQILAVKGLSKERRKELSQREPYYRNLDAEHWHIENIQINLKMLLDEILENHPLSNSNMFKRILLRYNEIPKSEAYLSYDGTIKDYSPFGEALFLSRENIPLDLELIYNGPISYCVVEFFRGFNNIKYLKKCKKCNDFIITRHIGRQFCDEPKECKKIYYNKDRARRMKEDYRNPASKKFKEKYI